MKRLKAVKDFRVELDKGGDNSSKISIGNASKRLAAMVEYFDAEGVLSLRFEVFLIKNN